MTEPTRNPSDARIEPIPTQCRWVLYTLTEQDADAVNGRRANANRSMPTVVHVGNHVEAGDEFPMLIVRVWAPKGEAQPHTAVNGQVHLDGNDVLWVTSVQAGEGHGRYAWPMGR